CLGERAHVARPCGRYTLPLHDALPILCTCIGITSSWPITSRIDCHACGLARTSSELVSSTADTPTSSPSTSRLTLALPSCAAPSDISPPPPVPAPDASPPLPPIVALAMPSSP